MVRYREEVSGLEQHCTRLTAQLNSAQDQLDAANRADRDMTKQVRPTCMCTYEIYFKEMFAAFTYLYIYNYGMKRYRSSTDKF